MAPDAVDAAYFRFGSPMRATRAPRRDSSKAMEEPTTPFPTTTTS
nr:hypothetical protein [Micromonospora sagamiensis]